MKRKAEEDAAVKLSKTPKRNLRETDFTAEFSHGEDAIRGANRNSKHGREGRS